MYVLFFVLFFYNFNFFFQSSDFLEAIKVIEQAFFYFIQNIFSLSNNRRNALFIDVSSIIHKYPQEKNPEAKNKDRPRGPV